MGDLVARLDARAVLAVRGATAPGFLQGLVTCDVRRVTPAQSTLGAACNAQGRVLATFRLLAGDDGLYCLAPHDVAADLLAHLQRMVFRAKVAPADVSADHAVLGLSGPRAPAALAALLGAMPPAEVDGVVTAPTAQAVRVPGLAPRFEVRVPRAQLAAACATLESALRPADEREFLLGDIRAGVPWIHAATAAAFLPQNLDLERLSGLSFTKGCYVGQEIVARTQHLGGELRRRLVRGRLATAAAAPPPGTALVARHADGSARDGGRVVEAAAGPDGVECLAVVPVAELDAGTPLHVGAADGPRAEFVN